MNNKVNEIRQQARKNTEDNYDYEPNLLFSCRCGYIQYHGWAKYTDDFCPFCHTPVDIVPIVIEDVPNLAEQEVV